MRDKLFYYFILNNLDFKIKNENENEWEKVTSNLEFLPVNYSNEWISYQNEFLNNNDCFVDCSIILIWDNISCGVLPISLIKNKDGLILRSQGSNLLAPKFINNFNRNSLKKILRKLFVSITSFCLDNNVNFFKFSEIQYFSNKLTPWHEIICSNGFYVEELNYEMFVDLSLTLDEIKSNFRDSYKSLINSAKLIWKPYILNKADKNIWVEFKNLHFQVSGRKTRSDKTWDIQLENINKKKGVLIYLRDEQEIMIGGAYFDMTKDEALYSVGVYRRDFFSKPVGHLVQFLAIEYFKNLEIKLYKLGQFYYKSDLIDEKLVSINHFKKGFANIIMPQYLFSKI